MADIFQQRSLNGLGSAESAMKEKCYNGMKKEAAQRTQVFVQWLNSGTDRQEGVEYMLPWGSFDRVLFNTLLDSPFFNPGKQGKSLRAGDGIAFIMSKVIPGGKMYMFVVRWRPYSSGDARNMWLVRIRHYDKTPGFAHVTIWDQPFD